MNESIESRSRLGRRLSRRTALAGVGAGIAGLAGLAGAARGKGGRRQRKNQPVTKTFRQFTPLTLDGFGEANPYPSQVTVSGFKPGAKITDLDVTLHDLNFRALEDLDILLQAPTGERCIVLSDAGNTAEAGITLRFDDSASQVIEESRENVPGGTYRPVNYETNTDFGLPEPVVLARFNGNKPNGIWRLFVFDDRSDVATGGIDGGWSLRITAKTPR